MVLAVEGAGALLASRACSRDLEKAMGSLRSYPWSIGR